MKGDPFRGGGSRANRAGPVFPGFVQVEIVSMTARLGAAWSVVLAILLAGCGYPVGLYHNIEGGAIAQQRQAPPGADLPYPNLAEVPPAPPPAPTITQKSIDEKVRGGAVGVSPPSPAALAGLELPTAPPPLPDVPGLNLPATPSTPAPPPAAVAAAPAPSQDSVPVALGFLPGSAVLPPDEFTALQGIAAARGNANILAGGFGDNLPLALARARRLADALTASGVPPADIRVTAMAAGSGGFVQLVY